MFTAGATTTLRGSRSVRRIASTCVGALTILFILPGIAAADLVGFGTPSGPILSPGCATVDVVLTRTTATAARGISVTIQLSSELALCTTPTASITRGPWLDGYGAPFYDVADLGGGRYRVDQAILGTPCGPTGSATLFTISLKEGSVAGATGTVSIDGAALSMTSCTSGTIATTAGGPVTVNIGGGPPGPVTGLTITKVQTGNDADGTAKTRVEFTLPAGATEAEIYCAPYGNYPEYDDPSCGPLLRQVNFQTPGATTPAGYEADTGLPYDASLGYGWLSGPLATTERGLNPGDPRDTFAYGFNFDPAGVWEIDVGPGPRDVQVRVLCGDPFTQGRHLVTIEGVVFLDNVLTNGAQYAQATKTVTVGADGKLTMEIGGTDPNAPPLSHTKVNLIEISAVAGGGPSGSVPPIVTAFPPPTPYVLAAGSATSPYMIESTTRDYYFYVVYAKNGAGQSTPVMGTNGVVNYHLGDIFSATPSPGVKCAGDNVIDIRDLSFFGENYGRTITTCDPAACIDIAPLSTTAPTVGLPLTDNVIDFNDLNVFASNYGAVSKPLAIPKTTASNLLELVPVIEDATQSVRADLALQGAGDLRAVSVRLGWDPLVVEPVGMAAGELLETQGGVALQPAPGCVDFALLGPRDLGLAGEGVAATVRFRRLRDGDPMLAVLAVEARDLDGARREIAVAGNPGDQLAAPRATGILGNAPNPFNPSTKITFSLARSGDARLTIYSLDGRVVRRLVDGSLEAGLHDISWDGTNSAGSRAASGVYYVRLATDAGTWSHPVVLVK